MDASRNHDDRSSDQGVSNRAHPSRRPISSPRHSPTKPSFSYLKPGDKNGSTANSNPRYVLFLDKTRMPTFYDSHHTHVPFTNTEVELWLRRLRILYQIDKGRNYGEVIDSILSILQFIPANLLLPLVHITAETYATDEMMLNDIARARMYMLEDWAMDGDARRPVTLTEAYRTMSPSMLVTAQQTAAASSKDEEIAFQSTVITLADYEEPSAANFSDLSD